MEPTLDCLGYIDVPFIMYLVCLFIIFIYLLIRL